MMRILILMVCFSMTTSLYSQLEYRQVAEENAENYTIELDGIIDSKAATTILVLRRDASITVQDKELYKENIESFFKQLERFDSDKVSLVIYDFTGEKKRTNKYLKLRGETEKIESLGNSTFYLFVNEDELFDKILLKNSQLNLFNTPIEIIENGPNCTKYYSSISEKSTQDGTLDYTLPSEYIFNEDLNNVIRFCSKVDLKPLENDALDFVACNISSSSLLNNSTNAKNINQNAEYNVNYYSELANSEILKIFFAGIRFRSSSMELSSSPLDNDFHMKLPEELSEYSGVVNVDYHDVVETFQFNQLNEVGLKFGGYFDFLNYKYLLGLSLSNSLIFSSNATLSLSDGEIGSYASIDELNFELHNSQELGLFDAINYSDYKEVLVPYTGFSTDISVFVSSINDRLISSLGVVYNTSNIEFEDSNPELETYDYLQPQVMSRKLSYSNFHLFLSCGIIFK